ncbi:TOPRIM domain protein [Sulfolobus islandicus Y.G.57.14]|jgi:DNA primase|uniref:DNA primase DnaG n=7 Tax=Saccharolobus islandicus TaxID=43080 RepID=DNAG_SACI1|nr:DNA primase DnaG [Sulfolobus islandicus]C3MJP0.1 RecName: Full=DNA primase DnaG [Sulfolobus islandicus L.S.2.15]C3MYZ8.1 RecName: Full=DNA primase DnaG [Sulfolobus islandicus M.14.25]C3N047.1 RecName: Full=DNA primase DnaG [Sulfolobus islandicus M.16.27]C3N8R1.1 RecName: Full=DNA primase DnaG [Sulfolobus islandicus Y.G.57.14]C3NMQ7.1 RecName: Full=DNA primase DnaG [Sulfolobus islandicus Y.N.15.51]C4KJ86.1 RecName: Full=DNA primase DnaG [Sulfolobus islandicus M.16.4]ACP36193.1 TOPRIM domai
MKYDIKLRFEVEGIVEKTDVIGAIFGQTENLFGDEFDLRELQDKGRLGRIIVEIRTKGGKSEGEIIIPSNLDRIETALIAAMVESVDKVGPYNSKFELIEIEDIRAEKLKKIIERAKGILSSWSKEKSLDIKEVINEISSAVKVGEITEYGPERLPAGPDVDKDPNLIIVEGRADVINLLRYGYKNVIAVEGATSRIPETVVSLSKMKKTVIAFLDGDHGGDLILKELLSNNVKIDFVARAPVGREVEELTGKEIAKALSNMMPLTQYLKKIQEAEQAIAKNVIAKEEKPIQLEATQQLVQITLPQNVLEEIKKLPGTLEGVLYDNNWNLIEKVQVRDIIPKLEAYEDNKVAYIVFDGVITQRLLDLASQKNIKMIIGARIGGINKRPQNVDILTFTDIISS